MPEDFADRLKTLMRAKRITLKQIGEATGKSISAVQKWTTGGDITYDALRKLADYLGVNWVWLRYGEEALSSIEPEVQNHSVVNAFRRKFIADIQDREALLMLALGSVKMAAWQNNLLTGEYRVINDTEVLGTRLVHFDDMLCIILPEDLSSRNRALEQALQNNVPYECDYRIRRPDTDEIRWIRVRGKPVQDPVGRPVRLTGIVYDITEMKQAELVREKTQQRLDRALEAAEEFAWEWVIGTGEIWHSGNSWQIFGIAMLKINFFDEFLHYVHPEDQIKFKAAFYEAVARNQPLCTRFRVITEEGAIVEIEDHGKIIHNESGQPERMVGISRRVK